MKTDIFAMISKTIPNWLHADAPASDIIISSRLRYARNIAGYRFPAWASDEELSEVFEMIQLALEYIQQSTTTEIVKLIKITDFTELQGEFLLERHLISPDFFKIFKSRIGKDKHLTTSGIFISNDETISIMVNEEDHLRFQVICGGFDFDSGFSKLNLLDDILDSTLRFAFSPQYGYLTACPTNVGTGLRVSIMAHLPGLVLTKEINQVLNSIWQLNYLTRGLYGEGTDTKGYFFQISNSITLGQSEQEIIQGMKNITTQLINHEQRSRDFLLKNMKTEIEDKVYRAYAILNSARLLNSDEALNLLATVRLGIVLQIISNVSLETINKVMILLKPANLQVFYNQVMNPYERDEKRAALIRTILQTSEN
ncbi:MAG: protein arginine kinase [candidate division WOR-3 bacterium]|nr:protein arginine kinase [candidate division WOR-3 bacterium]